MNNEVALIHKINDFYKYIYQLNKQMNKRDRLGLGQRMENLCLEILTLATEAAYLPTAEKQQPLQANRI